MTRQVTVYDPPEGWRYGFPKPYLPLEGEKLEDTLRRDGYPEGLIHLAKYTRFLTMTPEEPKVKSCGCEAGNCICDYEV